MAKKKLFISYRRDNGDFFSELLYSKLNDVYDVFIDHHSLGSGYFSQEIKHAIHECDVFLLVLSKDALKYRKPKKGEEDVYKQEIKYALEQKKKIVPIELKGFEFPKRSHGFGKEIKKLKKMQHFFFTDLDYIEPKIERLRQKFIDNDSSCFEDQSDSVENENEYRRLCWIIILILFWITLSVILACLLIPLFYDDPNGQAQGTVGGLPQSTSGETFDQITDVLAETTEHQTEESTREAETSTNNGTENDTNEEEDYSIISFGFVGETKNRYYDETFQFYVKSRSPQTRIYLIYKNGYWKFLAGSYNNNFTYKKQGDITWKNVSHIAAVPCDHSGNEIRENACIMEVSFSYRNDENDYISNPLENVRFTENFYEVTRGDSLKVRWTQPLDEELDVYYCLGIYKGKHGGSPLFYEDRIFRTYFVLDEEVTLELEPGEYYLRLFTVDQSDVYLSWYTMVELIVD